MSNQAFSDMAMQRILRADQARSSDTASFAASGESAGGAPGASSRLKSRIYSRLIELEQQQGPLRVLAASRAAGEKLCIFEAGLALLPGEQLQSRNPCAICHARVLGERVERAPIFWPGCPYATFCNP